MTGLVQGVGFRYFTSRRAVELGLDGYVRNLPGGEVEAVVSGDRGLIQELAALLRTGPRGSRVTGLRMEWIEAVERFSGFEIR